MKSLGIEFRGQVRASAFYIVARLLPGMSTAAFTVLVIRWLPPERYVSYSITLIAAMVASSVCTGWWRQGLLRFRSVEEPEFVRGSQLTLVTVALSLLGVAAVATGYHVTALVVLFFVLASQMSDVSIKLARSQAQENPQPTVLVEVVRATVPLVLILVVARAEINLVNPDGVALLMLSAGYAAAALISPRLGTGEQSTAPVSLRRAWDYGWPMSVWLGVSLLTQYVDRAMLVPFTSPSLAGTYAAAYDVAVRGATLILGPLALAAQPAYMRLRSDGSDVASRVLVWALAGQGAATLLGLSIIVPSYRWMSAALGIGANISLPLFMLLVVTAALWNAAILVQKPLEFESRTRLLLALILGSLLINVLGNVVLIPRTGVWGAAWATLLSTGLYIVATFVSARRDQGGE